MKKKFIFIILLFSLISSVYSYSQQFTAQVSQNSASVGDQIQISFTLANASGNNFKAPNFKGFSVLMGPSQSQNMQIINGNMSQSISYSYVLQASAEGTYTIAPATIEVGGKILKTNPITVTVSKGARQNAQSQNQGQGQNQDQQLNKQANDLIKKHIFFKLNVSKKECYQGEQVIATYTLYVHPELRLVKLDPSKMPSFNGFWTQEIDIGQPQFRTELLNGVPYNTAVVKKVVLVPQQTGKVSVDPYIFECIVRLAVQGQQRRRSIFDDFFGNNSYRDFTYMANSGNINLNVKPLPGKKPDNFSGGVGSLSMKAWLDRTQTKTNEPVNLKIQVSGTGNLKLIEPFKLNLPPDIETFDPKIQDNITVTSAGVNGNRTFEYLLIPRHAGEYKIDPVKFTYFNLSAKQYETISSNNFVIKVLQGAATESTPLVSGVNKEDVKFIGKDIRFLKTSTSQMKKSGNLFYGSFTFWLLNILPFILFILFLLYLRKQQKLRDNQALIRTRRATKIAKKRLSKASNFMTQKQPESFYEELTFALWGYLADKLNIPLSELTKDNVASVLNQRNTPEEITSKYLSIIDSCEFARYAPSQAVFGMEQLYADAVSVITEMEGLLK